MKQILLSFLSLYLLISVQVASAQCTASISGTTSICQGDSVVLTASGGTSYQWSANANNAITDSVNLKPAFTTTYTVTASTGGCTATATEVVTVTNNPTVSVPNASICLGGSAFLTASGANLYSWSPASGLNATTGSTVTANPSATTTYTVTGTTGACSGTTTVIVTVSCTGIYEQVSTNQLIVVYPNPFIESTTFVVKSAKANETYSFELYDVVGKQVKFINEINASQFQFSRSELENGIYFYKIRTMERIVGVGKLVIK